MLWRGVSTRGVARRCGLDERDGGQGLPERASHQGQLDRAQSVLAGCDGQATELDQRGPRLHAGRLRQQLLDGLRQPSLLVGQLEVHDYSFGSWRIRSAMMFRWICCVPPRIVAVRENR